MTSGRFHSEPISSITVPREDRVRRTLQNIPAMAESLTRRGLIHPIVISPDRVLVAGETRLEAAKLLGWTHIACQYTTELPQEELKLIELEENIKRSDIPWIDLCNGTKELHSIHVAADPSWTLEKTAVALGEPITNIKQRVKLADSLKKPELATRIATAPRLRQALNIVERIESRQEAKQAEVLAGILDEQEEPSDEVVLTADFHEWAKDYSGPRFNLLHCDFPYGINADKFNNQGGSIDMFKTEGEGYEDSPENYFGLIDSLHRNLNRLCADSAHLIFWFAMIHYEETRLCLKSMGWAVNPYPLIWHKSDNSGIVPDPARGPRRTYETAFFASRGDRKIVRPVANSFSGPTNNSDHISAKPEEMLKHFFGMLIDSTSSVLDPTCGSGNALKVAKTLGADKVFGVELNPEFAERARRRLA